MKKSFIPYLIISFILSAFSQLSFGQSASNPVPPGFKFAPSDRLPVIAMPAINVDSMLREDAIDEQFKGRPYRFGYNHLVYYKPENSGTWTELANGDRIWQLDVKTPGSYSVNFAFTDFHLPVGAKLFVYSKDHAQVQGPFTSANNTPDKFFGSELVQGDEAVLEYYEPAAVRGQSSFILFTITQGYKDLFNYLKSNTGYGAAGSCIHNINCPQYYDYATQKRAVVCILSNSNALCSGALVNNTLNNGTPYILTANHCGTASGAWVFRFNWEAPGCDNPSLSPPYQSIFGGGTTVAQSGVSDFNLVRMDSTPPASIHPFYAGWNYGLTPATSVTVIHHPEGDIKKGTRADNAVTDTFYDAGNGPAQVWQIGQYTDGATEPGSSGSPLFDQNKRIIGQLYGGPSDCGVPADQLRDYYGRFNVSWDSGSTPQTRLKDWLDPGNLNPVTNDGYDPYPISNSFDIQLSAVLAPVNNYCTDSVTSSILVTNVGTQAVSSITVNYYIDNAADSVFVWTGNLAPQAEATIILPAMPVTSGDHVFYANINLPAGSVDQNLYNDSISSVFITFGPTAVVSPLVEEFESGAFPAANWTLTTPPSGTTWTLSNYGAFGTSAHSAVVNEWTPPYSTAGEKPALYSPPVNMSNTSSAPLFLKFDVAYGPYDAINTDSLAVLVSTNCGNSWTIIYQKGGLSLATAPDTNVYETFLPNPNQWRKDSVDISNLAGQPDVLFEFEIISGWGNAIYVDNINIADTSGKPLGVTDVADNNMLIQVFPNPFTQNFNLQFNSDILQNINAALYSTDGKKLIPVMDNQKVYPGLHQLQINTGQLSNGLYILKVNDRFFKLEKLK